MTVHVEGESREANVAAPEVEAAPDMLHAIWRQAGLCAAAQADGVPCEELGHLCEECEQARRDTTPEAW